MTKQERINSVAARLGDRRDIDTIICNGNEKDGDDILFFGDDNGQLDCEIELLAPETTLADILVMAGVFPSRNQARKSGFWQLEPGWTDMRVGKFNTRICVWNPIEDN